MASRSVLLGFALVCVLVPGAAAEAPIRVVREEGILAEGILAEVGARGGVAVVQTAALSPSHGWVEVNHAPCGPNDHFLSSGISLVECQLLCLEHGSCDAISYNSQHKSCRTHEGEIDTSDTGDHGETRCYQRPASTKTTTTTCVASCQLGDEFKNRLEKAGVSEKNIGKVCRSGNVFFFDGSSTAVGAGRTKDTGGCDSSTLFCAGGNNDFGNKKKQALAVKAAIDSDGVHPEAPAGAKALTIAVCPTTATTTTTAASGCHGFGETTLPGEVLLDFERAEITQNNLGGVGPDSGTHELRYSHIMTLPNGKDVDLVVVSESPYVKAGPGKNGKSGKFGQINLMNDREVELRFRFELTDDQVPVSIPNFFFSIADLDQGRFLRGKETLAITGFDSYHVTKDTEVYVGTLGDGRTTFSSSTQGYGSDNPTDPEHLTDVQANRMVTFHFSDKNLQREDPAEFHLSFSVGKAGGGGRYFVFSGRSAVQECDSGVVKTTTTTPAPPAAEVVCNAMSVGRNLNFFDAEVVHNNLGGLGPMDGDAEMRYDNVAKLDNGDPIDMIITALGPYNPHNVELNGKYEGAFGLINLQAMFSGANVLDLELKFVDPANHDAPVTVGHLDLSLMDLDQGRTSAEESITIGGFDSYYLSKNTEVEVAPASNGRLTFSSSKFGERSDNPADPMHLTQVQQDRTVNLVFTKVSTIPVTLKVATSIAVYGRDFMFGGRSAVKDCGIKYNAA